MNIYNIYKSLIVKILNELVNSGELPEGLSFDAVTSEPPREASHGDIATNAAMVIAKPAGKNPREIATMIASRIKLLPDVESVDIAGPGFINIRLKISVWQNLVIDILKEGIKYGNSDMGKGEKLNVEYVSANPTGPMHVGHSRGAVFGDALANLLIKAGYNITKEYYINDAGAQVETLTKSAFLRYREALGEEIGTIPEGLYPGEYMKLAGKALVKQYGDSLLKMDEKERFAIVRKVSLETMLDLIKTDLKDLGIEHDVFTSEKKIQDEGRIEEALKVLDKKGLIYKGVLEAPKGKQPEDWEPREQTLFKSSQFGDDVDRPLKKSDGSWTYFAADVAYHMDKIKRGYNRMILELGSDHGGYLKRLKAAVSALSDGQAQLEVKFHAIVNFMEDGVPLKMSKRAGTFATVRDVINEVGKDVIRFIMLTRKNDVVLDFDLKKVKEQSKDNPVFYVQYAHARAKSVLRNAENEAPDAYKLFKNVTADTLKQITSEDEIALIKQMAMWPRIVETAAATYEPHRIAFYLQDLAAEFHSLWNKGKDNTILRFIIQENAELTAARLALINALAIVIESALLVFNINALEEMR